MSPFESDFSIVITLWVNTITNLDYFCYMDKQKGLGDTVAAITMATGIELLVKSLFGENCGCDVRQEKLNEMFPYSSSSKEDKK